MIYFRKRFISFILNCMSLASIVLMLQTALSLLVLVNSNPSLPQSMRDNAQQVAQQAIAQATDALKQNATGGGLAVDVASQAEVPPNINITVGNISTTPSTAHIEWNTSILTDSKIFYHTSTGTSQVVSSGSGRSTHHIADISNLTAATRYFYTIEAIAGQQDQKISGSFSTTPGTPEPIVPPPKDGDQVPNMPPGWHYSHNGSCIERNVLIGEIECGG